MENTSGFAPVDMRILVKPDAVQEKIGAIYVPDQHKDKAKYAATKATVIAVGCNAYEKWGVGARKPGPGERVIFAQYTGAREKGADGEDYIFMNDEDLLGVIEAGR